MKRLTVFILLMTTYINADLLSDITIGYSKHKHKHITSVQYTPWFNGGYSLEHRYFVTEDIGLSLGIGHDQYHHFRSDKSLNISYDYVQIGLAYKYLEVYYKYPYHTDKMSWIYIYDDKAKPYYGLNILAPISYKKDFFITPFASFYNMPTYRYWTINNTVDRTTKYFFLLGIKFGFGY